MRKNSKGMGGHQSAKAKSVDYMTPPEIIQALGTFDLDPATPVHRPWDTALHHFNRHHDGLKRDWFGRVWLNPPYGRVIAHWMGKMSRHNNGIALIFNRGETQFFFDDVYPAYSSMFQFEGRLWFHDKKGVQMPFNGGAPLVLIAYGQENSDAIASSGLRGHHSRPYNAATLIVVGISGTWKQVIEISITRLSGKASLVDIYDQVERIAPDKVRNNPNFKEKVRQRLQQYFERADKGVYTIKALKN